MRIRRTLGLAVIALGLSGLFACSSSALSPSSPNHLLGQDAQQVNSSALKVPVANTLASSFSLSIDVNGTKFAGQFDAASQLAAVDMEYSAAAMVNFVATPDTLYAKGLPGVAAEKFAAVNLAKVPPTSKFGGIADPVFALNLIGSATNVFTDGTGAFKGTVDINKVSGRANTVLTVRHVSTLITADNASIIPFTATVVNGVVTSATLTFPGASADKDLTYSLSVSGVGQATKVSVPGASAVVPAPDGYYAG